MTVALAVFALTYLAIAAGRVPYLSLDRPATALLGAVLMVAAGVLSPRQAGAAVNGDTLGLLLGMMVLGLPHPGRLLPLGQLEGGDLRLDAGNAACGASRSRPAPSRPSSSTTRCAS